MSYLARESFNYSVLDLNWCVLSDNLSFNSKNQGLLFYFSPHKSWHCGALSRLVVSDVTATEVLPLGFVCFYLCA